ncbi:MAG: hypothetical protein M3220_15150 [Chloroflexota bacterium]|nr:hypothetical protein [Chloroflexota bacterium]
MEKFLGEYLLGQEVEVLCLGGGKFAGVAQALKMGVVTLEWEDKKTHIACDKIVAVWPKEDGVRPTPSIGFAAR